MNITTHSSVASFANITQDSLPPLAPNCEDLEHTEETLRQRLETKPTNPYTLQELVKCLFDQRKFMEAFGYALESLKIRPSFDVYQIAGDCMLYYDKLDEATQYYREGFQLERPLPFSVLVLAECLILQGKYDEPLQLLNNTLPHPSVAVRTYELLCFHAIQHSDFDLVPQYAAKVIISNPTSTIVLSCLAEYWRHNKDVNKAESYLSLSLQIEPKPVIACIITSIALRNLGKFSEAEAYARKAVTRFPQAYTARKELFECFLAQGNYIDAVNFLDVSCPRQCDLVRDHLMRLPDDQNVARAHERMGRHFMKLSENDHAITHLQRAVQGDPTLVSAHERLAVCLINQGKFKEACTALDTMLSIVPESLFALLNLAYCLLQENNFAEAEIAAHKALLHDPGSEYALNILAECVEKKGAVARS